MKIPNWLKRPCSNYTFAIGLPNLVKKALGVKVLRVGTGKEWNEYGDMLRRDHSYLYWFEEVFCDKLQDIVCYIPEKYSRIISYLKNVFIYKPHYLKTGLPIGVYDEISTRMLHGLFNTLAEFIEIEKAAMQRWSTEDKSTLKGLSNRELGLMYLDWEINEASVPHQSEAAQEQKDLYLWWKDVYPNRMDPYDLIRPGDAPIEYSPYEWTYKLVAEEEARQTQEDEEMLIRLIKIRHTLWT